MKSIFERVKEVNEAFGNLAGDPQNIDWSVIRAQCKNILDEFRELQEALGADEVTLNEIDLARNVMATAVYVNEPILKDVRDSLCDIAVFSIGGHHLMGIDWEADMSAVLNSLYTRFVKDDVDMENTSNYHASKGVTQIAYEGDYPMKVARSMIDQPDAPKGKFLKSASYTQPSFYSVE